MKTLPKRICICPKDIQLITGKSYRQSLRIIEKIKEENNKPKSGLITIEEFCNYTGLNIEQVTEYII